MSDGVVRASRGRLAIFAAAAAGVVATTFLVITSGVEAWTRPDAASFTAGGVHDPIPVIEASPSVLGWLATELALLVLFALVAIRTRHLVDGASWRTAALAAGSLLIPVYLLVLLVVVVVGESIDPGLGGFSFLG